MEGKEKIYKGTIKEKENFLFFVSFLCGICIIPFSSFLFLSAGPFLRLERRRGLMEMSSVPPLTSRNPSSSTVSEFDFQYISPRSTSQKRGKERKKGKIFLRIFRELFGKKKGGGSREEESAFLPPSLLFWGKPSSLLFLGRTDVFCF